MIPKAYQNLNTVFLLSNAKLSTSALENTIKLTIKKISFLGLYHKKFRYQLNALREYVFENFDKEFICFKNYLFRLSILYYHKLDVILQLCMDYVN